MEDNIILVKYRHFNLYFINIPIKRFPNFIVLPASGRENYKKQSKIPEIFNWRNNIITYRSLFVKRKPAPELYAPERVNAKQQRPIRRFPRDLRVWILRIPYRPRPRRWVFRAADFRFKNSGRSFSRVSTFGINSRTILHCLNRQREFHYHHRYSEDQQYRAAYSVHHVRGNLIGENRPDLRPDKRENHR